MQLGSLPPRPLSLDELRDLEDSDWFRAVVPVGVFDLADSDRRLVAAVVFVTDSRVAAVGYDRATDENGGDAAGEPTGPPGAWTVVEEGEAGDKAATEERVRAMEGALREWAENQPWAEDPSSLVEAL
jgi:hypothetical protein